MALTGEIQYTTVLVSTNSYKRNYVTVNQPTKSINTNIPTAEISYPAISGVRCNADVNFPI